MSDTLGSLSVELNGRDVGLSTLLTQVDQKTQKAADGALRLQAQLARLQAAQGNTAGATQTLSNALINNGGASAQSIVGLSTQLTKIQQGTTYFTEFGNAAKTSLLGIVGPAAAATVAIQAAGAVVKSFSDAFEFKAKLDASTLAIQTQLTGVRNSAQVFQEATAFAARYALTQQDVTAAVQASVGVFRQSKAGTEDILGTLLRLQQLSPEQGLEGAALALKELSGGSTTSLVGRFEVSASAAAKMREEIRGGADAVKVLGDFLTQSGIGMDALANRTKGAAGLMNELAVAQEKLKLAEAGQAGGAGQTILETKIKLTNALTNALSGNANALYAAAKAQDGAYNNAIAQGLSQTEAARAGDEARIDVLRRFSDAASQAAVAEFDKANAAAQGTSIGLQSADAAERSADASQRAAAALAFHATAANTLTQDEERQAAAARDVDAATQQKANTDQVAAVNAQTHGVAQDALARQAQIAAQALLAAGGSGAATAATLASSSSQIDVLTAAYYRLYAAQRSAGAGATQQQAADFRSLEVFGQTSAQKEALLRKEKEADLARSQQIIQTGSATQKTAELQRQYNDAVRQSGPASAAAIQAQTALISSQQAAAKVKGGGGAGGGKLSDQQKLNNTLLQDQAKADDQYEQAELDHAKNLLKIQRDYQEKSLAQQKQNELSKRQSQADFYDRLTSSELNKSKGGGAALKGIDSQFQEAFAKSQQLAQQGNAKLANDYLALKQKQLEQELSFQENLAKAKEAKDKGEQDRLAKIQELRRAAAAEEEKQLLEGGDANQKAKDQATADENQRFQEANEKIKTSSDSAAERKIANAERAGKAIDAEQLKLDKLNTSYAQSGVRPASTTLDTAPTPTTTPTDAPLPLADAISGLRDALLGGLSAIERAAQGTTSAVRSLKASGGVVG